MIPLSSSLTQVMTIGCEATESRYGIAAIRTEPAHSHSSQAKQFVLFVAVDERW